MMNIGKTTVMPHAKYRVLATDWETEAFTECWTENVESAQAIADALSNNGGDVTVQIDRCVGASEATS